MQFEDWMKSKGLSKSSIDKYVGAIDGPLTSWAMSYNFLTGSIRKILDPEEFAEVSKKIVTTPEYEGRNKKGHHMYSAALKQYAQFLTQFDRNPTGASNDYGPHSRRLTALEASEDLPPYMPEGQEDARLKVLSEVVRRRGQQKFRAKLINAYEAKCAITGCTVLPILEAAHITPYLGPATNETSNGILLRADIHTLWDLGLIALSPNDRSVWVSPKIADMQYQALSGSTPFQPREVAAHPSIYALQQQWNLYDSTNS